MDPVCIVETWPARRRVTQLAGFVRITALFLTESVLALAVAVSALRRDTDASGYADLAYQVQDGVIIGSTRPFDGLPLGVDTIDPSRHAAGRRLKHPHITG